MSTQYVKPHRFISVKKSDPQFENYLWGKAEPGVRPVPIETFNLDSPEETVTFEMLNESDIKHPDAFSFFSNLVKLRTFILILTPLFFVLSKNFVSDRFNDPFSVTLAAIAVLFLYAGLNIRNDVVDHLTGFDRVNIAYIPKPILSGWMTAQKAARISWVLIGLSVLISLPIFILENELFRVISVVVILFLTTQFLQKNSYKQTWVGEWALFLLLGPALVAGYQVSLGAGIDTQVLAFGVLWGSASLFMIQVNNFSHLLTSSQAKIRNTMTKMGFDHAKRFLIAWWIVFTAMWFAFHWFYATPFWTWFGTGLLILSSLPLYLKMKKISSPLGSDLKAVRKESLKSFLMMSSILVIENFWYVGVKLDWTL